MLKLLTKFKTQSLNEVKPYENNGSFVSFCGEIQNYDDDGAHNQSWQQDTCGSGCDQVNGGGLNDSQAGLTSTCFISKLPNELVKTIRSPTEEPSDKPLQLDQENKENGDKRGCLSKERQAGMSAEKRKWSDMKNHRWKQLGCSSDSSSSDEEVKELFSKQQRSEQPSRNENRQYNSVRSGKVRPCESHARKRHRLTFSEDRIYRPSLDFEKMQQKVFWKRNSYTASRPRIVKVRSFSGHPHNLLPDPSIVSFKPIKGIQAFKLTPVEDPQALAF